MMIIEIKICNDIRFFYSVKGEIPECFNYDPDNKSAEYTNIIPLMMLKMENYYLSY